MELTAAIKAIQSFGLETEIKIFTDSNYVKEGITSWIDKWKLNNWKTANKNPVKNKDLWLQLDDLCSNKKIHWIWVKAHSYNKNNNKVDELAKKAATELIQSL